MKLNAVESCLVPQQQTHLVHLALAGYPREVCGVVFSHDIIVQYRNISPDPEHNYDAEIDMGDNDIKAIWHSHPNGPNTPSDTDLQFIEHCERHGMHFRHIIVTLKGVFEYEAERDTTSSAA
jgi:proteasome lid subunit RPN8/RPN11